MLFKILRPILIVLTAIVIDFFIFPPWISPFGLPEPKKLVAVAGLVLLGFDILKLRRYELNKHLLGTFFLAVLYSVTNLVAVEVNDQFDFTYANYITTTFVWFFSAYTCTSMIRWIHGRITIRLIASYVAAVCSAQCLLAIAIDKFEVVSNFVETIASHQHFKDLGRLHGFCAALDPAGIRFASAEVLIAFVIVLDEKVKKNSRSLVWYLINFIIIGALGSMVARTTLAGVAIGISAIAISTGVFTLRLNSASLKITSMLGGFLLVGIPLAIYLYNTDEFFYEQFRFAFEAFFNFFEKGELRTDSTDVLSTMWKWPETTQAWIIGTGEFADFRFGTDIGYCRFILYSGVIGFGTFCLFFIFNTYALMVKYPRYTWMFVAFLALNFIVWMKVATDIFYVYALFLSFWDDEELALTKPKEDTPELLTA